jgi:hypothetical protein
MLKSQEAAEDVLQDVLRSNLEEGALIRPGKHGMRAPPRESERPSPNRSSRLAESGRAFFRSSYNAYSHIALKAGLIRCTGPSGPDITMASAYSS